MAERPIIFSGEMVKAILAGRKTQTRRVIQFPHGQQIPDRMERWIIGGDDGLAPDPQVDGLGRPLWIAHHPEYSTGMKWVPCPYGQPGDRLWVRETWAWTDSLKRAVAYRADGDKVLDWKPSIHMRREYSRITLAVVDVRVQRVQEISLSDIEAEGADYWQQGTSPVECFAALWDSINAKRGYPWRDDPWVWCIAFRRID